MVPLTGISPTYNTVRSCRISYTTVAAVYAAVVCHLTGDRTKRRYHAEGGPTLGNAESRNAAVYLATAQKIIVATQVNTCASVAPSWIATQSSNTTANRLPSAENSTADALDAARDAHIQDARRYRPAYMCVWQACMGREIARPGGGGGGRPYSVNDSPGSGAGTPRNREILFGRPHCAIAAFALRSRSEAPTARIA